MARDAARHSKPDGDIDAHGGEESANLVFDNNGLSHNAPEGSIVRNVQRVEAVGIKCEANALHSGVEQPTITQAEPRHQLERERKGKRQRQRKRATTQATLEEALARVETAGASLDTLNMLDSAIVSAKRILEHSGTSSSTDALVVSSASGDLPELLRQAEEKSLSLRGEIRAMAKAAAVDQLEEGLVQSAVFAELSAHVQEQQQNSIELPPSGTLLSAIASSEDDNTCVLCLASPKDSLLLPCNHMTMCAECTQEVLSSSSQPQCPVCGSRVVDCIYGLL